MDGFLTNKTYDPYRREPHILAFQPFTLVRLSPNDGECNASFDPLSPPLLEQRSEQEHPPESSPARGCGGTSPPPSKHLDSATPLSSGHAKHEFEGPSAACNDSDSLQNTNEAVRVPFTAPAAAVAGLSLADEDQHSLAASADVGPTLSASQPLLTIDSLAKFTLFLSLLVVASEEERAASTTERERSALAELLSARRENSSSRAYTIFLVSFFCFPQRASAAALGNVNRRLGRLLFGRLRQRLRSERL